MAQTGLYLYDNERKTVVLLTDVEGGLTDDEWFDFIEGRGDITDEMAEAIEVVCELFYSGVPIPEDEIEEALQTISDQRTMTFKEWVNEAVEWYTGVGDSSVHFV